MRFLEEVLTCETQGTLSFLRGLEFAPNSRLRGAAGATCSGRDLSWQWTGGPRSASAAKSKKPSMLNAAEQAEADAASHRDTPEKKRQRIAELEERARLFGDPVKQSKQAKVLERKWVRFLLAHGDEYDFDEDVGPTVKLVEHFVTYCFCTRDRVSAIGREGLGDSFELQIRYMLAKFVFVSLEYDGWTGLSEHEQHTKAEPYKFAVREQWQRLKRSDPDLMSTLKPFVKTKWCDTAYFLAQVRTLCCV